MTLKGIQITCSGCGENTFMEVKNNSLRPSTFHQDGAYVDHYNENQSESWVKVQQVMDLCPRCQKIHEKMLASFYEECGKARDEYDREND